MSLNILKNVNGKIKTNVLFRAQWFCFKCLIEYQIITNKNERKKERKKKRQTRLNIFSGHLTRIHCAEKLILGDFKWFILKPILIFVKPFCSDIPASLFQRGLKFCKIMCSHHIGSKFVETVRHLWRICHLYKQLYLPNKIPF